MIAERTTILIVDNNSQFVLPLLRSFSGEPTFTLLDFRYEARRDEYFLVDYNARYWSSLLGSRAMGVNFPALIIALTLGNQVTDPGYRKGHYFFSSAAVRTLFRNLFSRNRHPVRVRDSQLYYIIHDPLPELEFLFRKLKLFRRNIIH